MNTQRLRPGSLLIALLLAACGATAEPQATAPSQAAVVATAEPASATTAPAAASTPEHPDPVVRAIMRYGRTDSQVNVLLREMTDRFGPRLTGSHNLMAAEVWARDQLAGFGLQASLEKWGDFPVGFDRGPQRGAMLLPERVELDFITPSWTPGVYGPATGAAILYPHTLAEARALGDRLEGAWIVHRKEDRQALEKSRDPKLESKIDKVLDDGGALGYVNPAMDRKGELVHTFGRYRITWKELPTQVNIMLRGDQHKTLVEKLEAGTAVSLEFAIDNRFFNGPVPQHNVIADIPGTEKPDEYVIIGGHIDTWDGAHGVVDNGTGVATTMEAARLLMKAGARPKRTIRFMLWSGEEQGLLGSEGYVKAHPGLMDKVSAVLVHDGGTNYLSGLSVTPEMAEAAKRALEPVFDLDPAMPFGLYYSDGLRPGGSDHNSFITAGVPGFFWHQAGKAEYDHAHHTQYDLWDAMVPEYQQHSAMVVALAAWGFANLDEPLDRTDSKPLGVSRRLGVQLDENKLTEVMDDSNAARLGMKVGDVIVKMDGKDMKSMMDIVRGLRAKGDKRVIVYKRGKRTKTVTLDFDAGPVADERRARKARRAEKFGELDFEKPFAGREPPKEHQGKPHDEAENKKQSESETKPKDAPAAPAPTAAPPESSKQP